MTRIALVNMYLHKFANPEIHEYDTLSSEDRWNEYFDVILANPPFFSPTGGITPHDRFGVKSTRAEVLFVDYIMEHLKPKGRAGIIVPEGVIFQTGKAYKTLRKQLVESSLVGVISLPAGVFQPYSGVKTSILILDKELNQKSDSIFFAKVENDGFSLGAQRTSIKENDLPEITTINVPQMDEDDPQNIKSYYGKILSIDLATKNIDILSMGHRNQQGLYYDSKEDIIFSTEHGPQGGDEINAHINPNKNIIKNYGWAISSYGEHYGGPYSTLYKIAPLNKSHKNFGFEEPIKYFTPSIGITQILKVNNSTNNDYKLLVGSMGYDKEEDDMTMHILNFNKDFEETKYEKIYIGERIRDMIDLNNGSILMTLESTGSLGLLKDIY